MNTVFVQRICIGSGAVIGVNPVVARDILPNRICAGNRAKFIKNRETGP